MWIRVARFFLVQHIRTGKNIQMTIKYAKWPQNIPNGRKIDQLVKNVPTSSIA
jgi:hypothetical protein